MGFHAQTLSYKLDQFFAEKIGEDEIN